MGVLAQDWNQIGAGPPPWHSLQGGGVEVAASPDSARPTPGPHGPTSPHGRGVRRASPRHLSPGRATPTLNPSPQGGGNSRCASTDEPDHAACPASRASRPLGPDQRQERGQFRAMVEARQREAQRHEQRLALRPGRGLHRIGPGLPGRRRPRARRQQRRAAAATKARSSMTGVTGPSTTGHHCAASATLVEVVRDREPEGLAATDAERGEPLAHGLIGHVVHEAGVELLELVLVELRRRARDMGEVDRGGRVRRDRRPAAPPRPSRPARRATPPPAARARPRAGPCSERWPRRFDSPSPLAVVSRLWWREDRHARARGPRRSGSAPPCW